MKTSGQVKVLNFQDPTNKTAFGTFHGRTVFHLLKKLVGNQYLKVLRILVPPDILVLLELSTELEKESLCLTEYFYESHI